MATAAPVTINGLTLQAIVQGLLENNAATILAVAGTTFFVGLLASAMFGLKRGGKRLTKGG
ncbi:MAG TPA: hypothetical protein VGR35_08080 [Tepidisphaeraceae bacterium]|nr:hypothetical protein [Tepidisphaeraceae bacterium]